MVFFIIYFQQLSCRKFWFLYEVLRTHYYYSKVAVFAVVSGDGVCNICCCFVRIIFY